MAAENQECTLNISNLTLSKGGNEQNGHSNNQRKHDILVSKTGNIKSED